MFWTRDYFLMGSSFWLLLLLLGVNCGDESGCQLPDSWTGSWFLSGHPERIRISERALGWLGNCHQRVKVRNVANPESPSVSLNISDLNSHPPSAQDTNKYLFYRGADNCFQCVALWSRHTNVLEYKAGECGETEDTESLCDISPDTALNTMVRVDGDNIPCPIQVRLSHSLS